MSFSSSFRKSSCLSRRFSGSRSLAKTAALATVSPTVNQSEIPSSSSSSPPPSPPEEAEEESQSWSTMLPELLGEIMERVEASEDQWPQRQNVVTCACVCKKWREAMREIVRASSPGSGKITFPSCLKQPGPSDFPNHCIIKRCKKNSTFYLFLSLTPSFTDKGKFLLAARRYRHGAHIEYIISLDADDLSQSSNAYVGKLSSDFLGTNFTIYDSQPPHSGAKPSSSRTSRRFASKRISPQVPAGNFEVGKVSYKFNLLKSRGPRRMVCSVKCPLPEERADKHLDDSKAKIAEGAAPGLAILKNKAPRWHEHLQCWCLNFHGRVTVASVKNFQLAATVDPSQPGGKGDEEKVLLQFGKVGDDTFTMDYRSPLSPILHLPSALQALVQSWLANEFILMCLYLYQVVLHV